MKNGLTRAEWLALAGFQGCKRNGGVEMKPELELETPRKVELLEVIHTEAVRGKGTNENPVRVVHQYWDKDGNLLAEKDDCK